MPLTFGIIGYGRFGQLWAEAFVPHGRVLVYDKKFTSSAHPPALASGISFVTLPEAAAVDFLWLAVPVSGLEACCQGLAPFLPARTVVADTCAVKVYPAKIMPAVLPAEQSIIATHPLFGPDSVARLGLAGRKIVVCPLRTNPGEEAAFLDIIKKLQLNPVVTTPDQHDRQMARSQALVHLLGRAFADLHLTEQEISTPDYESLLRLDSLVNNDTWQLFFDMQVYNPYTPLMRLTLRQSLDELEERIRQASAEKPPDDGTFFLWRSLIDQLDHELICLIAHRLTVGARVQAYKKLRRLPVSDPERERELAKSYDTWIKAAGLSSPAPIKKILQIIISEVKNQPPVSPELTQY